MADHHRFGRELRQIRRHIRLCTYLCLRCHSSQRCTSCCWEESGRLAEPRCMYCFITNYPFLFPLIVLMIVRLALLICVGGCIQRRDERHESGLWNRWIPSRAWLGPYHRFGNAQLRQAVVGSSGLALMDSVVFTSLAINIILGVTLRTIEDNKWLILYTTSALLHRSHSHYSHGRLRLVTLLIIFRIIIGRCLIMLRKGK